MANQMIYKNTTFSIGDMIDVAVKVKEGDKTRLQIFSGLLIATSGREDNRSFTVRKIGAHGIGVERIFPILSPEIDSITLKASGTARRAKLFYLRERTGREALRVKAGVVKEASEATKKLPGTKGRKSSPKVSKK